MPQLSGWAACFRQGAREGTLSHRQKTGAEALINRALLFLLIRGWLGAVRQVVLPTRERGFT